MRGIEISKQGLEFRHAVDEGRRGLVEPRIFDTGHPQVPWDDRNSTIGTGARRSFLARLECPADQSDTYVGAAAISISISSVVRSLPTPAICKLPFIAMSAGTSTRSSAVSPIMFLVAVLCTGVTDAVLQDIPCDGVSVVTDETASAVADSEVGTLYQYGENASEISSEDAFEDVPYHGAPWGTRCLHERWVSTDE